MTPKRAVKYSVLAAVSVVVIFAALTVPRRIEDRRREIEAREKERQIYLRKEARWNDLSLRLKREIKSFNGVSGIYIKDLENGFTFEHNKNTLFPSASLSKIPIMGAVYKARKEGRLSLEDKVTLNRKDKLSGSGNVKDMAPGTAFSVEELVRLMISISDNTATNMLTNVLGMEYINNAIKVFGLSSSGLSRRVADYEARDRGLENYTTAGDMGHILESMYTGELVDREASEMCMEMLLESKLRDRIPKYLPLEVRAAHKTGLEKGVCHDVGIVLDERGDFLVCVLTKHSNRGSMPSKNFIARITLLVYQRHEDPVTVEKTGAQQAEGNIDAVQEKRLSVKEVQIFLKKSGLYQGEIDGKIGPATRKAIREFQSASGLRADGIVGKRTSAAMREISAASGEDMFRENEGSQARAGF